MDDSLHSLDLRHLEPALVMQYARKVNSIETAHLAGMPEEKVRNLLVLEQKLIRWFIEERDAVDSTGSGRPGEGEGGLADELQLATDRAELAEEELHTCKEALRAERDAHETLRGRHEHVADEADVLNQTVTALREELAANYESSADEGEGEGEGAQAQGEHTVSPGKVRGSKASSPKKHGSPSGRRRRKDEWSDESDSFAHRGEGEGEEMEETSLSEYSESERDESDSEYDRRRRRRGGGGRSKRRGGEREGDRDRDFTKSRREADRIDRAAERTQRMMRGWLIRRRFRQYVRDIAMGKNVTFTGS